VIANPLLEFEALPAFDRIEAAHARPALEQILSREPRAHCRLDRASRADIRVAGRAHGGVESPFGAGLEPDRPFERRRQFAGDPRGLQRACIPLLTEYSSELGQNEALYAAYAYVLEHEGGALNPAQRKVVENALRDFRLAGVDLPAGKKTRFREVMQRLAQLGTKILGECARRGARLHAHVTDEAELAGLPANAVDRAAADAREVQQSGWLFKLDQPTYMTVMTCAESTQLRRDIYEAWVTRASELGPSAGRFDNNPLIAEILPLRHELAQLLGFETFADYALATRMAKSRQQVLGFLDDLARRCRPAATQEFAELEEYAGRKLDAWDVAFYTEKLKASRFKVSQEALRPYFPLPKCSRACSR
jgi:oligopeptidase A